DEKERAHYRSRKMFLMDMEHAMAVARDEGLEKGIEQGIEKGIEKGIEQGIEKGIEQGIEKGIEQGIEEGKIKVARAALAKGFSVADVADITGLDEESVKKLETEAVM
ncbi:MAG: hypothetical protein LBP30_02690, partial [Clostridiales Family XIII bacterium]|nr:hypothetical protein [Clostridiales Family XIII bacterium]